MQVIYHISDTEEKLWAVSIVRMDKSRRTFIVWWGNFLDDHRDGDRRTTSRNWGTAQDLASGVCCS